MVLKQLRLSRLLSQQQLAQMSGLSVRTIQRIERGEPASNESLKCLAAALAVDVQIFSKEHLRMDKTTAHWQQLPWFIKGLFAFNFLSLRPQRAAAIRVERMSHLFGFVFCLLGFSNEAALAGGLLLLTNAYLFRLHLWLGDKYQLWFDPTTDDAVSHTAPS